MRNIVLTRFNIATPGREAPIRNTPGWLDRRFDLFERFCLPGMAAQTVKDFDWLIYFDEGTPLAYFDRIRRAQKRAPILPRFVGAFDAQQASRDVAELLNADDRVVVTTRLDNDDAVARDFIERIRSEAKALPAGTVINFRQGLAMREGRFYSAQDESNPFTSLIETTDRPPQTIWSAQHHELGKVWRLRQVNGPAAWLQVVHGENVTNRIKGARLDGPADLRLFELPADLPIDQADWLSLTLDRLALVPARMLRERLVRLVKPLVRRS